MSVLATGYVEFGATASGSLTGFDCDGANLLVVLLPMLGGGATASAVTYNGVALTQRVTRVDGIGYARAEIWTLSNPASGANTIAVTLSATPDSEGWGIGAAALDVDDPADPVIDSATAAGFTHTLSVTPPGYTTGDIVFAVCSRGGGSTVVHESGHTRIFVTAAGDEQQGGYNATAGTVTYNWEEAEGRWAAVAAIVVRLPGSAPPPPGLVHDFAEFGNDASGSVTGFDCQGHNFLVALIANEHQALVSGITYNGVALTLRESRSDGINYARAEVWTLANPAAGANTLAVTLTAAPSQGWAVGVAALSVEDTGTALVGAATNAGYGASLSANPPNQLAGDVLFSVKGGGGGVVHTTEIGHTRIILSASTDEQQGGYNLTAAPGAMSYSWTGDLWAAMVAVAIRPDESISPPPTGVYIQTTDVPATVIAANPAGTVYEFAPGRHYRASWTAKAGDTYRGQPGGATILLGSHVLTGWVQDGGRYYVTGQVTDSWQHGIVKLTQPRAGYPEEVFFNGIALTHATSIAATDSGKFFVDYSTGRIWIYDNPAGILVTTSVDRTACGGIINDVTLEDLTFREYANAAQQGVINPASTGQRGERWTLKNIVIEWCHGAALALGPHFKITGGRVSYMGQIGIAGGADEGPGRAEGIVVDGVEFSYNCRLFQWGWEGGSTKFVRTRNLIVRNCWSHHNEGAGLWTDIDNENSLYEYNLVEDCSGPGIFHEISQSAIIRYNTVRRCGFEQQIYYWGNGILVAGSQNVEVHNNLCLDNPGGIGGIQQMDRGPTTVLTNLYVHDNTVRTSGTNFAAGAGGGDNDVQKVYSAEANNRWENNTYYLQHFNQFDWITAWRSWTEWRSYGHDLTGTAQLISSTNDVIVTPGPASLTLTGATPTVSASAVVTVEPGPAELVLTGATPSVTVGNVVLLYPGPAALVLTGATPTVTAGGSVTIFPGPASLQIQGQTPQVTTTSVDGGYVLRFGDTYVLRKL